MPTKAATQAQLRAAAPEKLLVALDATHEGRKLLADKISEKLRGRTVAKIKADSRLRIVERVTHFLIASLVVWFSATHRDWTEGGEITMIAVGSLVAASGIEYARKRFAKD